MKRFVIAGTVLAIGIGAIAVYLGRSGEQPAVIPAAATGVETSPGDPQVGDAAPDFSVQTLDDKELTLSSFRGKYVLMDFWASWCGPCRGETPYLKSVFDAHGKDQHFAIISLSLDQTVDDAKQYTAENDMAWFQGYLPGVWNSPLLMTYGVSGIPSIWLIGPDGKVVAKDLRGDDIETAVGVALRK
jgi:thiol-disulfide isomerase/thioredoxin